MGGDKRFACDAILSTLLNVPHISGDIEDRVIALLPKSFTTREYVNTIPQGLLSLRAIQMCSIHNICQYRKREAVTLTLQTFPEDEDMRQAKGLHIIAPSLDVAAPT